MTMTEEVTAERTLNRAFPSWNHEPRDNHRIIANLKLTRYGNNDSPHFSATGEILNLRYRTPDTQMMACGCIHDELLQAFPAAIVVVRVHLADDHGVPMYAIENGAYDLGFTKWQTAEYPDRNMPLIPEFARLWRITENEAREVHELCCAAGLAAIGGGDEFDRDKFNRAAKDLLTVMYLVMLPTWQQHADEALAYINEGA